MKKPQRLLILLSLVVLLLFVPLGRGNTSYGQETTVTPTDTPTPTTDQTQQASDLQKQISELQGKISGLQAQEKTLSSQISVMDSQINLTQLRINSTKAEITQLNSDIKVASNKVNNLESSLDGITKVLLNRIVTTYQVGTIEPLTVLLTSSDAKDFVRRTNYLKMAQEHDKRLLYDTEQAKNDYQNQKSIFEDKKQRVVALQSQLEDYTTQLDKEKQDKQNLLSDTQGNEANYQRLLAQAKAQLAGFSRFTASQGGASLLSGQTVCDDWGCYYNQRDTQWGVMALNGTQYTIASDGCLMTSMAMVYTHYGHKSVTPLTINSDSGNFASYYPAYLKFTVSADGATASRQGIGRGDIDGELAAGHPVIVGISYDSGPIADHFVVLISGSNGNYQMNDPFTPNGHNIPFTSHYSLGSMREIDKVTM